MSDHLPPSKFGQLVKRLQGRQSRMDFAKGLNVGETTVAQVLSGYRQRSPALKVALEGKFSKQRTAIAAAYTASPEPDRPAKPKRQRKTIIQKKILGQRRHGRIAEAKLSLEAQLQDSTRDAERYWLNDQLAEIFFTEGDDKAGVEALAASIDAGHSSQSSDQHLSVLRNRLAGRLQRRDEFAAAHAVVDAGLLNDPRLGILWRRKGIIHWYEHAYSDAYAALMTALECGEELRRIIHSRGCVLAEWGNSASALADLEIILDTDTFPLGPVSLAFARISRAHVLAQSGRTDDALREFADAESVVPHSTWLNYFRGLYYLKADAPKLATKELVTALTKQGTHLNLPKRHHAEALLLELGADVPRNH